MGENLVVRYEKGRRENTYYYHVGDGYHYNFEIATNESVYFVCNTSSCRGRAILRNNGLFVRSQPHNHSPNILYSEVLETRRAIMNRARSLTYVSFSDIIATERRRVQNQAVRTQLTLRRLRPAMQRNRASIFPNIPPDLVGLSNILQDPAWQCLSQTADLTESVYLGSAWGTDNSHNIVFMSRRCLDIMRRAEIIFADGTFAITPSIDGCYQVIPLCWCLMETKTEAAYNAILSLVRAHLGYWSFTKVVTDFEDAIINAFRSTFNVDVQGCFFHSVNAMAKHAKKTIGVSILEDFAVVKNVVRLCCCLPLLPQNLLQRGFNLIGAAAMDHILIYTLVLRPFLEYIQYDWILHANRGQTLSVCESEHRTNNASESNNRRMNRMFGVHHPNIFNFIRKVVEFEDVSFSEYCSLTIGIVPNRHRSVSSLSNDEHIQSITERLLQHPDEDDHIVMFLRSAAYTVDRLIDDALAIPAPEE